jgi:hypothetical protein
MASRAPFQLRLKKATAPLETHPREGQGAPLAALIVSSMPRSAKCKLASFIQKLSRNSLRKLRIFFGSGPCVAQHRRSFANAVSWYLKAVPKAARADD